MPNDTPPSKDMQAVLSSWKEIAGYLGKGVRTAQRWERELALPVHRPLGQDKGVVLAYPEELEAWAHRTVIPAQSNTDSPAPIPVSLTLTDRDPRVQKIQELSERLRSQTLTLKDRAQQMFLTCNAVIEKSKRGRRSSLPPPAPHD